MRTALFIILAASAGGLNACIAEPANVSPDTSSLEPVVTVKADCAACPSMNQMTQAVQLTNANQDFQSVMMAHLSEVQSNEEMQILRPISLEVKAFCDVLKVSEVRALPDKYIMQYEAITAKLDACRDDCTIGLNEAEYCAVGDVLGQQNYLWPQVSDAFQDASIFLSMAQRSNQSASEYLYEQVNQLAPSTQSHLADHMRWLASGLSPEENNPERVVLLKEMGELGQALQAMSWAGLGGENTKFIGETLSDSAKEIPKLLEEIHLAMTRAQVLDISEREAFGRRLMDVSGRLAAVYHSVSALQNQRSLSGPHVEANANDFGVENPIDMQAAADCFSKLSIETSILPEFGQIFHDGLNSCRTFTTCNSHGGSANLRTVESKILDVVGRQDKDQKLLYALDKSICSE